MMTNEQRAAYRRGLVDHTEAVAAELEKHPPVVREFMRANFQLHMYPLSFTEDFAGKVTALLTVTLQEVLQYRPQHAEDCRLGCCHWCGNRGCSSTHDSGTWGHFDCDCGLSALQSFGQAPRAQQEEEKTFARSDQPQLRACESDQRGDDRGNS